jgi:hypothetical protein
MSIVGTIDIDKADGLKSVLSVRTKGVAFASSSLIVRSPDSLG